ncbi:MULTISPECIES: Nif3-like dinuclear metal center hexameric protein [unclassified Leeuwenhoekiella]|uniref:Nif3-like dinuclear metal center hexameric protein n=1 Tax=unclassified Leeuwenhoekiella TaxID=2615029 RepID=UPI000C3E6100|nr:MULTISPECIES: Nif3-like dinuclear metal center hexameric protein [unclassified Leeuwenhoekiella]MAW96614.1 Nif3-like dinuclear metal center hexameric protein [Leeuwenhoekiella sp.]MBA81502.1 Nif3-like dinuclear metal center hexameric protein [Leeuwenhoekiella sp.]|tara:strand:- start:28361 stop:29455 length:1095 start_codon:yes stop_codon:yes gene_type:complete
MQLKTIIEALEDFAPLANAEDFDNVGLLIGNRNSEITGILVTLDTLEKTLDEAINKHCNLIVSFHPIIFSGLKKITGKNYVERVVLKAIQHNIAIYAIHTALDNVPHGVSKGMCDALDLNDRKILIPKKGAIKKLTTYIPHASFEEVRKVLFEVGAGNIGNYDACSFSLEGEGTFKGNADSNPTVGERGQLHIEAEKQLSLTFEARLESKVLSALFKAHPYEEVAFEVITLENSNQNLGMGMIGTLPNPMDEKAFLNKVKKAFKTGGIRHSALLHKDVKRVAVLGGSGSFAIDAARAAGADAYITADLKYHQFYQAENQILLLDIGHYESEQYTKNIMADFLTKKFTNFAVVLSEENTNPIKYL